jgi:hypothetical protein
MKKNKFGIIALIGVALYFIFKNKASATTTTGTKKYKTKVGANMRTGAGTNNRILKTFQTETELKFVKTQVAIDGIWYLMQELFPVGTISPSGENVGGNVQWTGWLREDVMTII